jgi:hypothetical protein
MQTNLHLLLLLLFSFFFFKLILFTLSLYRHQLDWDKSIGINFSTALVHVERNSEAYAPKYIAVDLMYTLFYLADRSLCPSDDARATPRERSQLHHESRPIVPRTSTTLRRVIYPQAMLRQSSPALRQYGSINNNNNNNYCLTGKYNMI